MAKIPPLTYKDIILYACAHTRAHTHTHTHAHTHTHTHTEPLLSRCVPVQVGLLSASLLLSRFLLKRLTLPSDLLLLHDKGDRRDSSFLQGERH